MPPIRSGRARPSRAPARPGRSIDPSATGTGVETRVIAIDASRKWIAAGLVGLLGVSLSAIAFVLYQLIASDAASTGRAKPFVIPANAILFNSLSDFEKGLLKSGDVFALTIAEAEVNTRLTTAIAGKADLPFRDVLGKLVVEQADFTGSVRVAGLDLRPTVSIIFYAQGGLLRYEISGINFGPVPVPSAARQTISDSIQKQLDTQKLTEKFFIDDVQIRPGFVTLIGRMK